MKIRMSTLAALAMVWVNSALRQDPSEEAAKLRREIEETTKQFLYQRNRANHLAMQSRSLETQLIVVRKKESVLEVKLERIQDALDVSDSNATWDTSSQVSPEMLSSTASTAAVAHSQTHQGTADDSWLAGTPLLASEARTSDEVASTRSPGTTSSAQGVDGKPSRGDALTATTADSSVSRSSAFPSGAATTALAATSTTTMDPLDVAYQSWESANVSRPMAAAAPELHAATANNSVIEGHSPEERRGSHSAASRETAAPVQEGSTSVQVKAEGVPGGAPRARRFAAVRQGALDAEPEDAQDAQPDGSLADFDELEVKLKQADKSLEESHPQSDSDAFDAYEKTFEATQSEPSTSVTTTTLISVSTTVPTMEVPQAQTVAMSTGNAFDNVEVKLQNEEKRIEDMDQENKADDDNEGADNSEAPQQQMQAQAASRAHDSQPVVLPQPIATPSSLDAEAQGAQQFLSQLMRNNPGLAIHRDSMNT